MVDGISGGSPRESSSLVVMAMRVVGHQWVAVIVLGGDGRVNNAGGDGGCIDDVGGGSPRRHQW